MAVESHALGPGQLSIGEVGSLRQFGAAIKSATLTPSVEEGETIYVLSGEETTDEGKETWVLEGNVLQAYDLDSLIVWCAENTGEQLPFSYRARSDKPLTATGTLVVRSIAYGGEVKKRNESSFSFKVVGKPTFATGV